MSLEHRVAMAPLTRYRWGDDWNTTGMKDMIIGTLQQTKVLTCHDVSVKPLTDECRVL